MPLVISAYVKNTYSLGMPAAKNVPGPTGWSDAEIPVATESIWIDAFGDGVICEGMVAINAVGNTDGVGAVGVMVGGDVSGLRVGPPEASGVTDRAVFTSKVAVAGSEPTAGNRFPKSGGGSD